MADTDSVTLALQAEFVVAALILVVWQILGPDLAAALRDMAEPILYPAMLALAAQLHLVKAESRDYQGAFVLFVIPAAYIVVLAGCMALHASSSSSRIFRRL